jgi:hypothetical protein
MGLILLIFVLCILFGGIGSWSPGGLGYGYGHSGIGVIGVILIIVVVLMLVGRL